MRCPDCKLTYPNDKQKRTYNPAMYKLFIRKGRGIEQIAWYCKNCGRIIKLKQKG